MSNELCRRVPLKKQMQIEAMLWTDVLVHRPLSLMSAKQKTEAYGEDNDKGKSESKDEGKDEEDKDKDEGSERDIGHVDATVVCITS